MECSEELCVKRGHQIIGSGASKLRFVQNEYALVRCLIKFYCIVADSFQ